MQNCIDLLGKISKDHDQLTRPFKLNLSHLLHVIAARAKMPTSAQLCGYDGSISILRVISRVRGFNFLK